MIKSLSVLFFSLGFLVLAILSAALLLGSVDQPQPAWVASSSGPPSHETGRVAPTTELSQHAAATPTTVAVPQDGTCPANRANDIAYLIFWPPLPGANNESLAVGEFATKLGTTGDGATRQLGFGVGIPVWVHDDSIIVEEIKRHFDTAKRTNVAVHFNVDDHIGWDDRPDLWNWYDATRRGYNPDNKNNVEWYDWEGTANKRRYFSPEGTPSQTPHMCYNSPVVRKEIGRIVSQVIGPALRKEIDKLKIINKEYLFAGVTVGQEAGFDDYSTIPKSLEIPSNADPMQKQIAQMLRQATILMDQDKAPHTRLGYCALTNAGYSKAAPPARINRALAEIDQKFIEFWDRQFVDAGIPCSRIYTHVAASPPQDDTNNAPIFIAFNPYARPGWTTYPIGTLEVGFQPLYDELAKHGDPVWGGVEANAALANSNGAAKVRWEEFLAWHYNHGAKLVGINVGASNQALMSELNEGAFGEEAMTAYKKFLNGEQLATAAQPAPPDTASSPTQETSVQPPLDKLHKELVDKVLVIQRDAPAWLQAHPDRRSEIGPLFQQFDTYLRADSTIPALRTAELILRLIRTDPPAK